MDSATRCQHRHSSSLRISISTSCPNIDNNSLTKNIMIKNILRLTRPKQWIKNFFVFIPMFFGGELFDTYSMWLTALPTAITPRSAYDL